MKALYYSFFCLFILCCYSDSVAKCFADNDFHVGNTTYYSSDRSYTHVIDTAFPEGEPLSFDIEYYYYEAGKECEATIIAWQWRKNNLVVSNEQVYTVTDTGMYQGIFTVEKYYFSSYYTFTKYVTLHVGYSEVTAVNEILYTSAGFVLYPSLSTGIFNVKADNPLSQILISDYTGRIVFSSQNTFSEIDLSNQAAGIYLYYIEDKSHHISRGKMFKE
jgi:hypothetical protein